MPTRIRNHHHSGTINGWIGTTELLLLVAATTSLLCGALAVGQQDTHQALNIATTDRNSLEQDYAKLQEQLNELETDLRNQRLKLEAQQAETLRLTGLLTAEQQLTSSQEARLQQQQISLQQTQQQLNQAHEELKLNQSALLALKQQLQSAEQVTKQKSAELDSIRTQLTAARRDTDTAQQKLAASEQKLRETQAILAVKITDEQKLAASEQKLRETQEILAAKLTDEQLLHKKIAALEIKLKDWGRIANSLVALRGPLKKVVFLYDTSGSMSKGDRFEPSRKLLQQWISNLQMESFAVIDFDNEAVCWMTSFQLATDASRAAANKFLAGTVAGGNTRTDLAIETAFRNFPDVDTIVLLTDGRMTDEKGLEVSDDRLALLRDQLKAQHAGVVINTIGIGDYYTASADNKDGGTNKSLGHFLQMIAVEHNGVFIGLGERSSGAKQ